MVLPRMTQPASRSRALAGASSAAGAGSLVREPRRVGKPFAQILSLMVAGTPSTALSGAPRRQRASDWAAAASAGSGSSGMKALSARAASMRAKASRATSTGEALPVR